MADPLNINDANLTGPRESDLRWDDAKLTDGMSGITESILSIQTDYSMDIATQVTVQVHDHNFILARNHYFAIGRTVWYRSWTLSTMQIPQDPGLVDGSRIWQRMEIASASMGQGPGLSAVWTIQLRPKGIQHLKRLRDDSVLSGSGTAFIRDAASWAGLYCIAQETTDGDGSWQGDSDNGRQESAWDVMTRVASEASSADEEDPLAYMLFEVDNVLFFGTQRWLLGRWGTNYVEPLPLSTITPGENRVGMNYIYLGWPAVSTSVNNLDIFRMLGMPSATRSDNNPLEVTGSLSLDRFNARALRPGMTIYLDTDRGDSGTPYFNGYYLISYVSFDHYGTGPVNVNFRSPERREKDMPSVEIGTARVDVRRNTTLRL